MPVFLFATSKTIALRGVFDKLKRVKIKNSNDIHQAAKDLGRAVEKNFSIKFYVHSLIKVGGSSEKKSLLDGGPHNVEIPPR